MEYTHITHKDIPIFIDKESAVLILGSLPSVKSREVQFYYGHPQNRFYKVLIFIFNEQCPISVDDKKEFLKRHHIALYDVIEECDIIGSSDASIKNPKIINLDRALTDYPNIRVIGVNGKKASKLFDKYLLDTANKHNMKVIYLPSTSPANATTNIDKLVEEYTKLFQ